MYVYTAIATVVTIAEILKNNGLAVEKSETFSPLWFQASCFIHLYFLIIVICGGVYGQLVQRLQHPQLT